AYPQLLGQKSAIRPGSIFNRQGGSVFNQRQQAVQGLCLESSLQKAILVGILPARTLALTG
ncbi:hypothetical protein, partial [Pseudomonas avellanae]|uniref:hypothetical protein n=1 Tax=Pseudomonas avellanae TaxID=46257 RepID=UPI0019D40B69